MENSKFVLQRHIMLFPETMHRLLDFITGIDNYNFQTNLKEHSTLVENLYCVQMVSAFANGFLFELIDIEENKTIACIQVVTIKTKKDIEYLIFASLATEWYQSKKIRSIFFKSMQQEIDTLIKNGVVTKEDYVSAFVSDNEIETKFIENIGMKHHEQYHTYDPNYKCKLKDLILKW